MGFVDKTIECSDCGNTFIFGAEEQEFFASKGYTNDPKRCPTCRRMRRSQPSGGGSRYGSERKMFRAVCAQCGMDTEVPFEPREGRPVYCGDCYSKIRQS